MILFRSVLEVLIISKEVSTFKKPLFQKEAATLFSVPEAHCMFPCLSKNVTDRRSVIDE